LVTTLATALVYRTQLTKSAPT